MTSRPDPDTGIEESLRRMGLRDSGGSRRELQYPERPGEQDCVFYLRNGSCGYGDKCRFNHPRDHGAFTQPVQTSNVEFPDRVGPAVCEHYVKTGTCRFGSACKYHHPIQVGSAQPVVLNVQGYPLRPGEKECAHYVRTGRCKFGYACKFHHPQPAGSPMSSSAPAFHPTVQPQAAASHHQYPAMASWQVSRPSVMPGPYIPGSYAPMLVSPGVVSVQGWSAYPAPMNPVVPPGGQQATPVYGFPNQSSLAMPAYFGPYAPVEPTTGHPSASQREHIFPQRPGQPECLFYMRTGDCKYGATCKYHHPPDWTMPKTNCVLSPLGLPLRQGVQPCAYYTQHGDCKFGATCKFDHPIDSYSQSTF